MKKNKDNLQFLYLILLLKNQIKINSNKFGSLVDILSAQNRELIVQLIDIDNLDYDYITEIINVYNLSKKNIIDLNLYMESILIHNSNNYVDINSSLLVLALKYENNKIFEFFESRISNSISNTIYPNKYILEDRLLEIKSEYYKYKDGYNYSPILILHYYLFIALNAILGSITLTQKRKKNNESYDQDLVEIDVLLKKNSITQIEIIVLRKTISVIIDNRQTDFIDLIQLLENNKLNLHPLNVYNIYVGLFNTAYINKVDWKIDYTQLLNIYKLKVESLGLDFFAVIHPQDIKNIATLCIRTQQTDWFDNVFNISNQKKITKNGISTLKICNLIFLFSRREYNKCLIQLNDFIPYDIFQDLEIRRLQIKCFYELGERVLVDNYASTFKVFIHRNEEVSKMYKESNGNFLKIISKLNKALYADKVSKLIIEINSYKNLAEKNWLIEKSTELYQKLFLPIK